jgi:hypothetical protein
MNSTMPRSDVLIQHVRVFGDALLATRAKGAVAVHVRNVPSRTLILNNLFWGKARLGDLLFCSVLANANTSKPSQPTLDMFPRSQLNVAWIVPMLDEQQLSKSYFSAPAQSWTLCVPKIRFCNIGDEGRRGQTGKWCHRSAQLPGKWGILRPFRQVADT